MKFVIAPDKYKGSLDGFQFCDIAEKALKSVFKDGKIVKLPMADGGDGTVEIVRHYLNGELEVCTCQDPLFRFIEANYLFSEHKATAYVEMAESSGLKLLKESEVNCMFTSSIGTGEMIKSALDKGVKYIILGIGGSATNDAGMGLAHALGYKFSDAQGNILKPIGANLIHIDSIDDTDVDPRLKNVSIQIASDVNNVLFGKQGAAYVYAQQKGANETEIEMLDQGLRNFSKVVEKQYGVDISKIPGGGAAGGVGAGALVFLNATIVSGVDLIKEIARFDQEIADADWIITGEGRLDNQTMSGKAIAGILNSAKNNNIPVAAFCGSVHLSIASQQQLGLAHVSSISKGPSTLKEAMKNSHEALEFAIYNFASVARASIMGY